MIKRILSAAGAMLLSLSSLFVFAPALVSAAVDTCEWDGSTSTSWNTAANWTCNMDGEAVPGTGDSLVFDNSDLTSENSELNNNITGGSFANITFTGDGTSSVSIIGNAFTLTGTIINNQTGGFYSEIENDITLTGAKALAIPTPIAMTLSGDLSGSGPITKTGTGTLYLAGDNSSYTGAIIINAGTLSAGKNSLATSGGTTINDGASLILGACGEEPITGDFTLTGAGAPTGDAEEVDPKIKTYASCQGGGGGANEVYGTSTNSKTVTISGAVTLGSDVTFSSFESTTKFTGAISGNYKFIQEAGHSAKIVIESSNNTSGMPNGTYQADILTKVLTDDLPNSVVGIYGRTVVTINGKRSNVTVSDGGTLKGTGTIGTLYVIDGSVAPGASPGCLTMGNLDLYGEYQFEAKGKTACTEYDQLKVTGTVKLTSGDETPVSATLNVSFLDKYNPASKTSFVIISNDGTDAVTGTFKGLAEGATFAGPNKSVLKVSYVGGDGNDVVVTVVTAGVPDTGFGLLLNNPAVTLAAAVLAGGAILMMSRRMRPVARRVRR